MPSFLYKRVVVIGVTSSGKSTLAETLAQHFDLKFIELDALNWEPNWQTASLEVFHDRVVKAMETDRWVVAGNYHMVRVLIWPKAEAVIWLDYPFHTVLWQLTQRTFRRWWRQDLGHQPRALMGPLQILVRRVTVSLVVQNVLEAKARNSTLASPTRTPAPEIDPFPAS